MTNFVSNAAAAAVGTPIAIATSAHLGVPMAYQTNLPVMSAAGYRFAEFARVGLPLVILMLVVLSASLVRRYGL